MVRKYCGVTNRMLATSSRKVGDTSRPGITTPVILPVITMGRPEM